MNIRLEKVDLGIKTIQVPIARIEGELGGPTLLITAGNDGNEYAGIAAAYKVIEHYSHVNFRGTLLIIPVVNIPGFESESMINPLDSLYPKYVYPGSPRGKPTERLRFWLSQFVEQSQMWLDLHDGALTERLVSALYTWRSGVSSVDELTASVIKRAPSEYAVFGNPWDRVKRLGRHGCGYILTESGAFGIANADAIDRHMEWVRVVMCVMGMIEGNFPMYPKTIFKNVHEYQVKKNGLWVHNFSKNNHVKKRDVLGEVRSLDGHVTETITAKEEGVVLWGKEGLRASAKDVVAGVGFNEQTIETIGR